MQMEHNPAAFDAFFQSVLQFPVYGLEDQVQALGNVPGLPIMVCLCAGPRCACHGPASRALEGWTCVTAGGSCPAGPGLRGFRSRIWWAGVPWCWMWSA